MKRWAFRSTLFSVYRNLKEALRFTFFVSANALLLWRERTKKYRSRSIFQALFGGLFREYHQ